VHQQHRLRDRRRSGDGADRVDPSTFFPGRAPGRRGSPARRNPALDQQLCELTALRLALERHGGIVTELIGPSSRCTLSPMTFRTVRSIGLRLPAVEETTMYGSPALKLEGRMVACIANNKSAEPGTLVLRTTFEQREVMIAEEPETYYLKPHYETFPVVLVRLSRVTREAMQDLLAGAVRLIIAAEKKPARRTARTKRAQGR
jgi:hypothetical protein